MQIPEEKEEINRLALTALVAAQNLLIDWSKKVVLDRQTKQYNHPGSWFDDQYDEYDYNEQRYGQPSRYQGPGRGYNQPWRGAWPRQRPPRGSGVYPVRIGGRGNSGRVVPYSANSGVSPGRGSKNSSNTKNQAQTQQTAVNLTSPGTSGQNNSDINEGSIPEKKVDSVDLTEEKAASTKTSQPNKNESRIEPFRKLDPNRTRMRLCINSDIFSKMKSMTLENIVKSFQFYNKDFTKTKWTVLGVMEGNGQSKIIVDNDTASAEKFVKSQKRTFFCNKSWVEVFFELDETTKEELTNKECPTASSKNNIQPNSNGKYHVAVFLYTESIPERFHLNQATFLSMLKIAGFNISKWTVKGFTTNSITTSMGVEIDKFTFEEIQSMDMMCEVRFFNKIPGTVYFSWTHPPKINEKPLATAAVAPSSPVPLATTPTPKASEENVSAVIGFASTTAAPSTTTTPNATKAATTCATLNKETASESGASAILSAPTKAEASPSATQNMVVTSSATSAKTPTTKDTPCGLLNKATPHKKATYPTPTKAEASPNATQKKVGTPSNPIAKITTVTTKDTAPCVPLNKATHLKNATNPTPTKAEASPNATQKKVGTPSNPIAKITTVTTKDTTPCAPLNKATPLRNATNPAPTKAEASPKVTQKKVDAPSSTIVKTAAVTTMDTTLYGPLNEATRTQSTTSLALSIPKQTDAVLNNNSITRAMPNNPVSTLTAKAAIVSTKDITSFVPLNKATPTKSSLAVGDATNLTPKITDAVSTNQDSTLNKVATPSTPTAKVAIVSTKDTTPCAPLNKATPTKSSLAVGDATNLTPKITDAVSTNQDSTLNKVATPSTPTAKVAIVSTKDTTPCAPLNKATPTKSLPAVSNATNLTPKVTDAVSTNKDATLNKVVTASTTTGKAAIVSTKDTTPCAPLNKDTPTKSLPVFSNATNLTPKVTDAVSTNKDATLNKVATAFTTPGKATKVTTPCAPLNKATPTKTTTPTLQNATLTTPRKTVSAPNKDSTPRATQNTPASTPTEETAPALVKDPAPCATLIKTTLTNSSPNLTLSTPRNANDIAPKKELTPAATKTIVAFAPNISQEAILAKPTGTIESAGGSVGKPVTASSTSLPVKGESVPSAPGVTLTEVKTSSTVSVKNQKIIPTNELLAQSSNSAVSKTVTPVSLKAAIDQTITIAAASTPPAPGSKSQGDSVLEKFESNETVALGAKEVPEIISFPEVDAVSNENKSVISSGHKPPAYQESPTILSKVGLPSRSKSDVEPKVKINVVSDMNKNSSMKQLRVCVYKNHANKKSMFSQMNENCLIKMLRNEGLSTFTWTVNSFSKQIDNYATMTITVPPASFLEISKRDFKCCLRYYNFPVEYAKFTVISEQSNDSTASTEVTQAAPNQQAETSQKTTDTETIDLTNQSSPPSPAVDLESSMHLLRLVVEKSAEPLTFNPLFDNLNKDGLLRMLRNEGIKTDSWNILGFSKNISIAEMTVSVPPASYLDIAKRNYECSIKYFKYPPKIARFIDVTKTEPNAPVKQYGVENSVLNPVNPKAENVTEASKVGNKSENAPIAVSNILFGDDPPNQSKSELRSQDAKERTWLPKKEKKLHLFVDSTAVQKIKDLGSLATIEEIVERIIKCNNDLAVLRGKVVEIVKHEKPNTCLIAFIEEEECNRIASKIGSYWLKIGSGWYKITPGLPQAAQPAPAVSPWEFVGHKVCMWVDNKAVYKMCREGDKKLSGRDIIQAVAEYNVELDTTQWKVVDCRHGTSDTLVFLLVDLKSLEVIANPQVSVWMKAVDEWYKIAFSPISKDDLSEISSPQLEHEKDDVLGAFPKGLANNRVSPVLKTWILHAGFPKVNLTPRESRKVAQTILSKLPVYCGIQFHGVNNRLGFLRVHCYGGNSLAWLDKSLEEIERLVGFPLVIQNQKEVCVQLWFPTKSLVPPEMTDATILERLREENPLLKHSRMALVKMIRGDLRVTLMVRANLDTIDTLASIDFFGKFNQGDVYFRTSSVPVADLVNNSSSCASC